MTTTRSSGETQAVAGRTLDGRGSEPAGTPGDRPWYRRRAVLVGGGLVALIAITVLTDLPQHASRPTEIAGDRSVMTQVNTDVGPCSYALGESLTIYGDLRAHSLTGSESALVPGLLRDDQTACSFTNESIYQLSTIEVPGSKAGKDLGQLVNSVTLWATSDALSAIEQIQTLSSHPSNAHAVTQLAKDERQLVLDRAQATAELAAADKVLRTKLPALRLVKVAAPARAGLTPPRTS